MRNDDDFFHGARQGIGKRVRAVRLIDHMSTLNPDDRHQITPEMFFRKHYLSLTGDEPFPWQSKLFAEFAQDAPRFRAHCPVPTGLGKTSVLAIWLLVLAHRAMNRKLREFPRRLAYVVNRRTVVDQATTEVEKLRAALTNNEDHFPHR